LVHTHRSLIQSSYRFRYLATSERPAPASPVHAHQPSCPRQGGRWRAGSTSTGPPGTGAASWLAPEAGHHIRREGGSEGESSWVASPVYPVNVNVNELRLGLSNTTRNPEGILSHNNRKLCPLTVRMATARQKGSPVGWPPSLPQRNVQLHSAPHLHDHGHAGALSQGAVVEQLGCLLTLEGLLGRYQAVGQLLA
jgi:hypothetical protein